MLITLLVALATFSSSLQVHAATSHFIAGERTALRPSRLPSLRGPRPHTYRNDALRSIGCLVEKFYDQRLDHFHPENTHTFRQRFFVCEKFWSFTPGGGRGPIFFYAGNEADVELYVNATGLIWENAAAFGANIVFAEHRYYGKSEPFGPNSWASDPSVLTVEQALADYAALLTRIKGDAGAQASPVIAFGGSYGGMLAAWMRVKYPHIITGAVAASAPVGAFPGVPGWDPTRFWAVATYDATAAAGSAPECAGNVRLAFAAVRLLGSTAAGRATLQGLLRLCDPLPDAGAAEDVAYWLQGAFDAYAMGNYPYPSAYISGDPDRPLPAWPMRAACRAMRGSGLKPSNLVSNLREAVGLLYNVSGDQPCFRVSAQGPAAGNVGPWDYQWCTELMAQELPYYPATGKSDMFWDQGPFNLSAINEHCAAAWGVTPRADWASTTYGGLDYRYASNIAFSNGLYDPWSAYGVLSNVSASVVALIIPEGAHHLDLMYSHPADPPSVRAVRAAEMRLVADWIAGHQRSAREGAAVEQAARAAVEEAQRVQWGPADL
ncbi:hypothetical protein HYH03_004043 [Edaphochlamys debaryana]|uniref:Lysosomal Pro-X carboxypeptidase n=1 Tax=Edaphochlamys debaryana TaxID=47281 RepID=A0A836C292_9CHLO|nr:hypothetical protein HYH03_004043 [Edaphochlamys debaryana]|eukprot:KAG2497771.1 hypothetical protein HYH03_004043 [Edaphochlamys debaryana]